MSVFMSVCFVAIIALLCAVTLAAVYLLSVKVFFASNSISKTKRNALTVGAMIIAALALFTIIFTPFLYKMLPYEKVKERSKVLILFITGMVLLLSLLFAVLYRAHSPKDKFFTTKNITRLAVFTALSVVLYQFVKFPLPFIFPNFLDIQFSEMPALLAGLMMGPEAGAIVIIIKILIKLPFTGTGGVGELGDLILGLVYVVSASIIYRRLRTKKGALISLITGSVLCVFTAMLLNRYVLIPFYTSFMFPWPALLGMVDNLYPAVTQANFYNYYLWYAVLPFNILRCGIVVVITFFMYKPTKQIFGFVEKSVKKSRAKHKSAENN